TPEQLVNDLLALARKLGSGLDVPEGVLSVEAMVPTPPHRRPALLAAAAVVAVIGLVLVLLPGNDGETTDQAQTKQGGKQIDAKGPTSPSGTGTGPAKVARPVGNTGQVSERSATYNARGEVTRQALMEWAELNGDKESLTINLSSDLALRIRDD